MDIDTTKIGERGQVVIPLEFREQLKLKKGEKMIAVLEGDKIILEAMKDLNANALDELKEDLADIKIANKFWDDLKSGAPMIRQSKEEFLAELEEW